MMRRVARRANVKPGLHILRHTFLFAPGNARRAGSAIQELAASPTQRLCTWGLRRRSTPPSAWWMAPRKTVEECWARKEKARAERSDPAKRERVSAANEPAERSERPSASE